MQQTPVTYSRKGFGNCSVSLPMSCISIITLDPIPINPIINLGEILTPCCAGICFVIVSHIIELLYKVYFFLVTDEGLK